MITKRGVEKRSRRAVIAFILDMLECAQADGWGAMTVAQLACRGMGEPENEENESSVSLALWRMDGIYVTRAGTMATGKRGQPAVLWRLIRPGEKVSLKSAKLNAIRRELDRTEKEVEKLKKRLASLQAHERALRAAVESQSYPSNS